MSVIPNNYIKIYSGDNSDIPEYILKQVAQSNANLLPEKSRAKYEQEYHF